MYIKIFLVVLNVLVLFMLKVNYMVFERALKIVGIDPEMLKGVDTSC